MLILIPKKRQEIPGQFNRNLYKLMVNCIYGKSIENMREKINVKLVRNKKKHVKKLLINQISCHKKYLIKVLLQSVTKVLTLNKPIYVCFCILELSKLSMSRVHYDYVLKTFDSVVIYRHRQFSL